MEIELPDLLTVWNETGSFVKLEKLPWTKLPPESSGKLISSLQKWAQEKDPGHTPHKVKKKERERE